MPNSVKCPLEGYEVVVQKVLLYNKLFIEDLFYCALISSKNCLFLCQQFLSLGLELVEDNSEHDLAGMAD